MLIENPPVHPHRWASFSLSGTWMWPQFLPFSGPLSPSTRLCAQTHPNVTERCSRRKQAIQKPKYQTYNCPAEWPSARSAPGETITRATLKRQCIAATPAGSSSADAIALIRHKRIHAEERPYKCIKCQSTFICSNSYKRHILTHQPERPLHERVHGRGFTYRCALLAHQRMMHIHSEERP